jgi:hypothetical protein
MPLISFPKLDLTRLEDAHTVVTLPDEPCEDLDGYGSCYCYPPEPDSLRLNTRRHMVVCGVNADATAYTSRRYFQL